MSWFEGHVNFACPNSTFQAFPCISTGVYGYPSTKACPVALKTVRKFIEKNPDKVSDLHIIYSLILCPSAGSVYT